MRCATARRAVLHHLESVSRGRRSREIAQAGALFRKRWAGKVERDDLRIYVEDGLLSIRYTDLYPLGLEVAPELATVHTSDLTRFVERQSHQVADLLRETVRLTAHVADVEVDAESVEGSGHAGRHTERADGAGVAGLVADAERLQLDIHAFQAAVAGALAEIEAGGNHVRRPFAPGDRLAYLDLKRRIAPVVEATVPPGATMVVVSRGDDSLLELEGRTGWHFPREEDGAYAGRHPADSREAIEHLEHLRERGAGYLVIPANEAWWLEHYGDFGRHLADRYVRLTHEDAPCLVFRLDKGPSR